MTHRPHRSLAIAAAACALLCAGGARAEPAFARLYKQQFGYTPSCNACHKDGGGTPLNAYGEQFKTAGMNLAAFAAIDGADADGDAANNGVETRAKANPGSAQSTPQNKGSWLDTASLIPREVQAAFPGITAYLPKDAVLSDADIARAKAMGATLTRTDENTIYIPLDNQRPAGTALIFPVQYGKKTFFLLLVTDRKLTVTAVSALNTHQVPEAAKQPVYASFKGLAVDQLPTARGESLEDAITRAVKNAGTLIYVRLKNA
ncbi:MAG TPA: hypothetical protein VGE51_07455 [Fontimonas sp.]